MKIPKYVDKLLKKRTRLACQLSYVCWKVDKWLDENGVEPDSSCYHTGVKTYVNPNASEREVRRAIEKKE